MRLLLLGVLGLLIGSSERLCAQTADPVTLDGPVQAKNVQRLIEQLGSNEFQLREQASAELLAIGDPALLALSTAEQGTDLEIRLRARTIRERIEREKFDVVLKEFMQDSDPSATHGLPGWKSFAKVAGATRTAKRLFKEMIETRRLVAMSLESIDGGDVSSDVFEGLPVDPQRRLWTVAGSLASEVRRSLYVKGERPIGGDVIALLVAVSVLDEPPPDVHDAIRSEFHFGGFRALMVQPSSRTCVRMMLGKWFLKAPLAMGEEIISMAHQAQVPEGADMARRLLNSPIDVDVKAKALICLSRFGDTQDLALIDRFVEDATVLLSFDRGDGILEENRGPPLRVPDNNKVNPFQPRKYERKLSDVALAVGLKLSGHNLEDFFPVIKLNDFYGILEDTIGFPSDKPEVRAAALKTWRDYRAKSIRPAF